MEDFDIERRTGKRLILTIGLFCFAAFFVNFLDRSNISYAALQMNDELGLDARAYGIAISLFFVGHMAFSIPGAEIARWLGSRAALAGMMLVWGALAAGMAFVHSASALYSLRFSLGVAEAGAGAIIPLLLTNWIPRRFLGRTMMLATMAAPVAQIVGGPLSGFIMTYTANWGGVAGWRWLFGLEGLVTMAFGAFTWFWLRNTPSDANWLPEDARRWVISTLADDLADSAAERGSIGSPSAWRVIADVRIWVFGLILFSIASGIYYFTFWLPQVLREVMQGMTTLQTTTLSSLPWVGMITGMLLFGWSSDRFQERPVHLAAAFLTAIAGLFITSMNFGPSATLAGLCLGALGIGGGITVFWTMPPAYLAGAPGAAIGFAFINVVGNMSGVITPVVIGNLRQASGGFESTTYLMIGILFAGIVLIGLVARHQFGQSARSIGPRLQTRNK